MRILTVIFFAAFFWTAGCLPDTSGVSPPDDKLIFPVGLVATHNSGYLLVANSNFDLRYNSGTLVAIDLNKLKGIASGGGKAEWLSRDEKFMYVPEEELIDDDSTIRLGAFASDLELTPAGDRAIVPVRGERAILLVEVDETRASGRVLSCGGSDDQRCDSEHKITSNEDLSLPIEPYEVTSAEYRIRYGAADVGEDGAGVVEAETVVYGFATHLAGGEVSAFIIDDKDGELSPRLTHVAQGVVPGASGISVKLDPKMLDHEIYVTGRRDPTPHISIMKLLIDPDPETGRFDGDRSNIYFGSVGSFKFYKDISAGTDARGIAVASSGEAFLVTRTPEALLRFDTTEREMDGMTTLGTDPSVVELYEDETGRVFAFVLCFVSNQVYIIEPDMMQVHVRATGAGPHAIAFDTTHDPPWAYIANFRESTVTIIEAVPPFEHVRVEGFDAKLMIGKPRLPKGHS